MTDTSRIVGAATRQTVAFVFDVDPRMLHNQTLPGLRRYGLEEQRIELRGFTNRNALLAAIANETRQSVALVDLQLDDRFDHNWSGHRVIETIRHHPALRRNCRPLALTVHSRPAIRRLVEAHGAYGIVCRGEIDCHADFDLAGMLYMQSRRASWGPDREVTCEVIPSEEALGETHDTEAEAKELRQIQKIFDRKRALSEKQWMALRYFAVKLDHTTVAQLLEIRYELKDGGSVVESLQKALRPTYREHGPDLYRASLDLFQALPAKRPVPTLELSFNELPRLSVIRDMKLTELAELTRTGYLDDDAKKVLEHVLFKGSSDDWPSGAAGQGAWLSFVRKRLSTLAAPAVEGIPSDDVRQAFEQRSQANLVRAVHNVLDTSAAKVAG